MQERMSERMLHVEPGEEDADDGKSNLPADVGTLPTTEPGSDDGSARDRPGGGTELNADLLLADGEEPESDFDVAVTAYLNFDRPASNDN